jgi:hypothetical protein
MSHEAELAQVEAVCAVSHLVTAVVAGHLVHLADILSLSLVHVGEIHEDTTLYHFLIEDGQHSEGGLTVESVAILGFDNLIALNVVKP